ncbi:mannose-1-phosphate guanylyltransferase [Yoonia sp. BS5-3]|uniref:Mannose-1-phosphate guanylyltransferase n=1 Tax=Yoonia phaeophyticola TaxID=3137369 RepID=A0ABZ3IEI0_9RHOB
MRDIRPIILCGGTGSRLWPMSRTKSPKQFQTVAGPGSLTFFQATVQRHRTKGFGKPVVVTALQHVRTVQQQLTELQCDATIICEPMARNTGPAVLAAARVLAKEDPKSLMLILPADHIISGNLNTPILAMRQAASDGRIVTFGITPTYPETGYGYITDGGKFTNYNGLHNVAEFVEKPPLSRATSLVATGMAYWASGISLYSAQTIMDEFARLDTVSSEAVAQAVDQGEWADNCLTLHPDSFRKSTNEPTERIIFERAKSVALAPLDVEWSDVGCWTSMQAIGTADDNGNVLTGDVISVDTRNTLVRGDKRLVAVVGVSDVIVVDTPDAVLVTARGKCQDVKKVVETLKGESRREAVRHSAQDHQWGQSQHVMTSQDHDMTMLSINPGSSITVDPLPGRQIIAGRGGLSVFDGISNRTLEQGERTMLDIIDRTKLTNTSSDKIDVLMVTLHSSISTPEKVDAVLNA